MIFSKTSIAAGILTIVSVLFSLKVFAKCEPYLTPSNDTAICEESSVQLTIHGVLSAPSVEWYKDGVRLIDQTSLTLEVNESGTYTAIVFNFYCGYDYISQGNFGPIKIETLPSPPDFSIITIDSELILTPTSPNENWWQDYTIKWFLFGNLLPDVHTINYSPEVTGFYTATLTNELGCEKFRFTAYETVLPPVPIIEFKFGTIDPNPARGQIMLNYSLPTDLSGNYQIYDCMGVLRKTSFITSGSSVTLMIDISEFPAGVYFMKFILSSGEQFERNFVVN